MGLCCGTAPLLCTLVCVVTGGRSQWTFVVSKRHAVAYRLKLILSPVSWLSVGGGCVVPGVHICMYDPPYLDLCIAGCLRAAFREPARELLACLMSTYCQTAVCVQGGSTSK